MRKPYLSDLTDEQWEILQPLIPVNHVGRPRKVDMREVFNAILYINRSGCQWDMLPHDFLRQEHRLRLLRPVARRRHLAAHDGRLAPSGPASRRA